jgi:DNA-binding transcriptional MerR regulator
MEPSYTIGQLARTAGVPASTVRFYERRGLIRPDDRTPGNYRIYRGSAIERLRFIRAAQANGFSLEEVSVLLNFRDGKTSHCREVQELIKERLADLEKRLEQLRKVQAVLRASLRACREFGRTGRCSVIERLNLASAPAPTKTRRHRRAKESS